MSLSLILPMSAFALVASISPGPVNIVGLSSGARYPLSKGLTFVTGATLGFIILFLAIGYGFSSLLVTFPVFEKWLTWAGIAFLLYLSYRLACDDGKINNKDIAKVPGFFTGFLMQWLNPKAWIASAASIGAYTNNGELAQIWLFAALYLPICWLSLSCWVYAGAFLRQQVQQPKNLRTINRVLAVLLAGSCLFLLFG
ncbi:LysE family translocator [Psychrobacter sp. LV10R520-6]|uniref:LysE family translocator n=1 Tax=Psychrobacter sp. LV10R520-6 TaxID=1415574 RepID=UPI0024CDC935|nr:LysE family translocator [Psychrobacter sp. LV10R520-6]SNT70040.1 Threonine/homoserine/homoserine lactone efflux protein [Psychrobacter sp. LV10R520-6]